jgi:predicted RNA binding protein YcfA (HicA-like mRNA interferase family)
MESDSRKIIKLLETDGWTFIGSTGSHHHFKHETKPGKVSSASKEGFADRYCSLNPETGGTFES